MGLLIKIIYEEKHSLQNQWQGYPKLMLQPLINMIVLKTYLNIFRLEFYMCSR